MIGDNLFSITSGDDYSFLRFYLCSFFVVCSYFLGPWFAIFTITFSIFERFIFRKRDLFIDVISFAFIFLFYYSTMSLFLSEYLNLGARDFNLLYLNIIKLYLMGISSLFFVFVSIFGKRMIPNIILSFFVKVKYKFLNHRISKYMENKVITPLRNKYFPKRENAILGTDLVRFSSQIVKSEEGNSHNLKIPFPTPLEERKSVKDEIQSKVKPQGMLSKTVVKIKSTFESKELINCIRVPAVNRAFNSVSDEYFNKIISNLEEKFGEFKIEGRIVNVLKGPVVDTFELELGAGVKVSKVTSISEDLSLALFGVPIRIVYPMKGKTTIGIEIPRNPRQIIYLDEILSSSIFEKTHCELPLALGKNAFGEVVIADLIKMPHMLIAGSTGAGKSVFINTLLVSLLIKKPPQKMKLILIDPKQLELTLYSNLEHLVLPVITDGIEASIALTWACQEMERRYSILKELGVRNVESFNEKIRDASYETLTAIKSYYLGREDEGFELPYIVIIIDEFADLIMGKGGKDLEVSICRLAAKARASGIHLIIATQRPSVDVITGLIKANFPTRISFKVTSSIDSRTILNSYGAEKLLGQGDMLYRNGVDTFRLHSGYIGENEVSHLIEKLGENGPGYIQSALDFLNEKLENQRNDDLSDDLEDGEYEDIRASAEDELFGEAVRVVREHRMASASMLQRRLKIGYNRAANLVESMEIKGIVGPAQGAKPREVYSDSEMRDS